MKGYKGFDKDLKCRGGYQYEIGRTETTDGTSERLRHWLRIWIF